MRKAAEAVHRLRGRQFGCRGVQAETQHVRAQRFPELVQRLLAGTEQAAGEDPGAATHSRGLHGPEARRNGLEGLVPGRFHKAAFPVGTHRRAQPVGVVEGVETGLSQRAGAAPAHGMVGVAFDLLGPAFPHPHRNAAAGRAHAAQRVVPGVHARGEILGRNMRGKKRFQRPLVHFAQQKAGPDADAAAGQVIENVPAAQHGVSSGR